MNHEHNKSQARPDETVYTCPMHPEVRKEKPGVCEECGMSLVPQKKEKKQKLDKEGYNKHAGHRTQMFFRKFLVSLILTIPVLLYSELPEIFFNFSPPIFPGSNFIMLIFGSIIYFYGGFVFLIGAWRELKTKITGMMILISLAITAAFLWSVYAVISGERPLFWELATLITVMLLGHWLEMRAVAGAQGALKELSKLLPDTAEVIRGDKTEVISLSELKENDTVLVRPGAKIPADGV